VGGSAPNPRPASLSPLSLSVRLPPSLYLFHTLALSLYRSLALSLSLVDMVARLDRWWVWFNVKRFRGGLVFKAHRWFHHSTLGSRVIKKKKTCGVECRQGSCWSVSRTAPRIRSIESLSQIVLTRFHTRFPRKLDWRVSRLLIDHRDQSTGVSQTLNHKSRQDVD